MDKPNLPTSLPGFTRKLSLRHSLFRLEVYQETPNGKILRRPPDVARYLSRHPQFRGTLSPADFDFKPPKLIAKKKHQHVGLGRLSFEHVSDRSM
ncbi:hypothetical protein ACS0TY_007695 [Phlomoides rotata]